MGKSPKYSIYKEKDKNLATFLLASDKVSFCGTELAENGNVVYFLFKPREMAVKLVNLYFSRQEPHIPAKILLEAVDNFRTILFKAKNVSGSNHEAPYQKV